MQTILGPFHPDLENGLVEEILKYKNADILTPLLILTPSDLLRRRLKILLTRERRLALLNVQLLTFYQLSLRLHAENNGAPLELRTDLLLEEALRQIIRTRQPAAAPFAGIESTPESETQIALSADARLFDDNKERKYSDFPKHWHCRILDTFGIHDEVAAAAKEILGLVDD